jgi:hypothetical protein
MSAHAKKRRTNTSQLVLVDGDRHTSWNVPKKKVAALRRYVANLVAKEQRGNLPSLGAVEAATPTNRGAILRGVRLREGLTIAELAERAEVDEHNLANMELGNRPIGKRLAQRLAKELHTDYRLFL